MGTDTTEVKTARKGRRRRRGSRRRASSKGFAPLIPHILTTGNLAAGFYAIAKASTGDPVQASWAILLAGIFDVLDGRAARMTNSVSKFGMEYDSIADTVSFGVAPAMIAFHAGHFMELGWTGWVMAFVFTACASLRLARFNVSSGKYRGRFDGLPSPAAAGMVVSTVWFVGFLRESGIHVNMPAMLPAFGLALIGLLMVSPIPYLSNKDLPSFSGYRAITIAVVVFIALIAKPEVSFFIVGIVYVTSGPFELYYRYRTGKILERVNPDEEANVAGADTTFPGGPS
ncbi:MAG: CDP-diacylglycerol--serine O-phosphatidyltransferase [Myxococcales bacterium]|nr:CDP-diacylglycerol--serine O-phosphatidyltransferase [Myxococcales bacterium]